jgi:hypothetical protein
MLNLIFALFLSSFARIPIKSGLSYSGGFRLRIASSPFLSLTRLGFL